jgi:hypothetical protein
MKIKKAAPVSRDGFSQPEKVASDQSYSFTGASVGKRSNR